MILKAIAGAVAMGLMAGCLTPGPVGETVIHDPSGDLRANSAVGSKYPQGLDLVRVTFSASSALISVTLESRAPIAEVLLDRAYLEPIWFVRVWSPSYDDPRTPYMLAAQLVPRDPDDTDKSIPTFEVSLCGKDERCSTGLRGEVRVIGHELEIRVPRNAMPKLAQSFDWSAQTWGSQKFGGRLVEWIDYVPDSDSDERPGTVRFEGT